MKWSSIFHETQRKNMKEREQMVVMISSEICFEVGFIVEEIIKGLTLCELMKKCDFLYELQVLQDKKNFCPNLVSSEI